MTRIQRIREYIEQQNPRSAWGKGVKGYALDLVQNVEDGIDGGYIDETALNSMQKMDDAMLNGASDWKQYSWGGCAYCYNWQIAEALCTPTELKKTRNGQRKPNPREDWLDVQARALYQAARMVHEAASDALCDERMEAAHA